MRKYLLLGLGLALASCAARKALPQYTEAEKAAQRGGISYWQPDSTSQADTAPHTPRWIVAIPPVKVDSLSGKLVTTDKLLDKPAAHRRLFGLLPPKKVASSPQKVASDKLTAGKLPRKCKGCTFNLVAGNQTVAGKKAQVAAGAGATATVIEKKAGPAVVASDSSTLHAVTGGGNLADVKGDGNALEQKSEAPKPKPTTWESFKSFVASIPELLLWAAGAAAVGLVLYEFAWPALVGWFRRNKTPDNQA